MVTRADPWTEERVDVAGAGLQLVKGGTGEPLLILHGEMGHPGWLRYHQDLSQDNTLYIPSHPGFGGTDRLDWIMNMRDLAGWYLRALDELALSPVNVIGLSLGGWLAAEMATMCPHQFKRLALVGSPGIRPPVGEIFDMFLVVGKDYIASGFLDPAGTEEFPVLCPDEPTPEQREAWEVAREEACRLSWRPYMHYPALPHLLGRLNPNPPMDGARTGEGGKGVTGAMIRARIRVDGRLAGGLQALLGAPMSACSGCGERDGRIGHGKRRSRTGMA